MSKRENNNDLLPRIKSIIQYLNGKYKNFGPKKMQNDRYLILLYVATMIDEFKQWGTKHRKLLYFSYNQLKKISKAPLLDPSLEKPLLFDNTRTARKIVYPTLKRQKCVRTEKINIESYMCSDYQKRNTYCRKKGKRNLEWSFRKSSANSATPSLSRRQETCHIFAKTVD